ncbi:uncharacterized protein LOC132848012 [Tachysurus vachellii]|uniref:uncharacterized protein LOC132848012 n=1 Tax=Tachysurus vachellii TaxID=175792 RepID=UPI00296B240B|nr:uncharacterized protein LOC132848012 [Tachysurus vachellii]
MLQSAAVPLLCLVVCFHQAVGGEAVRSVIGYISESVVLRSGADPLWTLKTIQWSIYENFTYIATFDNNETSDDRWPQFKDRLELNKTSGDLTIKHLKSGDSLAYTVTLEGQHITEQLSNTLQLYVRGPFPGPNITLLHSLLDEGTCVIKLRCSHNISNISLMWKPEHVFNERFWSDPPNVTRESELWTDFSNRDVTFFCIATDHNLSKSSQLRVKCRETGPSKSCCIWLILSVICLFFAILWIFRGHIRQCVTASWNFMQTNNCP